MSCTTRSRAALAAAVLALLLAAAPAVADDWAPPAFAPPELGPTLGVSPPLAPPAPADGCPPPFAAALAEAGAAPGDDAGPGDPAPPADPQDRAADEEPPGLRARLLAAARGLLGRPFRGDCSGFVLTLLRKVGVRAALPPARSRSEALFLRGERVERPEPGDLAFFHDTYDRNHDGRLNDRWTHVALVERVEGELVTLLHRGIHGVERIRMDLAHPSDRTANDRLRIPRKNEPPGTRHLAGELFSGFGAIAR
jgi:cell wall-associated NlpC family hydrolase